MYGDCAILKVVINASIDIHVALFLSCPFSIVVSPTDFESDLQEVWSVRKNVHHQGGTSKHPSSHQPATSSPLPSMQTAGHYSRHGAIPAQQSYGASVLPKIKDTTGKGNPMLSLRGDCSWLVYYVV